MRRRDRLVVGFLTAIHVEQFCYLGFLPTHCFGALCLFMSLRMLRIVRVITHIAHTPLLRLLGALRLIRLLGVLELLRVCAA